MAEFNVKTIDELQQLTNQSEKLDSADFIAVYETEDGTTNKISLETLKNLTLKDQNALGADSTFTVEDTNLSIGKKSVLVPTDQLNTYFENNGISLKVNDSTSTNKITSIQGEGVTLSDTTLTIAQTSPSIYVTDGINSFDIKDKDSSLHFEGAVSVDSNTGIIHINDKDTVLQAITGTNPEGINISKIASNGNINFSTSSLDDGSTLLTIGLQGTSTATQAFSLKAYEAISSDNQTYTCSEITSFGQDQVVAIHFNTPVWQSPTTLNGFPISYYNQDGVRDISIVNSIVQDYAILKKQSFNDSFEYRIIFADAIQTLYQDWQIDSSDNDSQTGFPGVVRVTSNLAGISFTALTPTIFERDSQTNQYYIKSQYIKNLNLNNLDQNFTIRFGQLTDDSGNTSFKIPKNYIPDDIGKITIVDGQTIQYSDLNETIAFTNSTSIVIPDSGEEGGEGGGSTPSVSSKLTRIVCSNHIENNIYNIDGVASIPEGFYLIQFDYGMQDNITGLGLKFGSLPVKYIYCDGQSSQNKQTKNNFIHDHDSLLFYYKNDLFYFISNDDANANRVKITHNEDQNVIIISQNGNYYTVNKADYTSKDLQVGNSNLLTLTETDTVNTIDFNLPPRISDSDEINSNYYSDQFLNGLGQWTTVPIPEDNDTDHAENKSEYFLNGEGEWSQPTFTESEALQSYLINLIFPVGSVYYTTDATFKPQTTGEGSSEGDPIRDWTEGGVYKWIQMNTITQNGETIYPWKKVINENYSA